MNHFRGSQKSVNRAPLTIQLPKSLRPIYCSRFRSALSILTASQIIETTPRLSVVRIQSSVQTATLTRVRRGLPCAAIDFWNLISVQVNAKPFAVLTGEAQVFALRPLPGSLWSLLVLTSCRWFSGLQARPCSQDSLFYGLPTGWLLFNV